MFKGLTKINSSVPIDFNLEKCRWNGYNKEETVKILERYEFKTLIARIFKIEINSEKE
jgi:hypothetical protein